MATRQRRPNALSAFQFDYGKAAQATALLLRRDKNRSMNVHRLLKLLYLGDRESLREIGRPILGGRYLVTARGPAHSGMLDLVEGSAIQSPTWATMFRREHSDLEMTTDPGCGELSKGEIRVLNEVAAQYENEDDFALGQRLLAFDEVVGIAPVDRSSRPIPFEDIVKAVGRGHELEAILRDAREKDVFDRIFGE